MSVRKLEFGGINGLKPGQECAGFDENTFALRISGPNIDFAPISLVAGGNGDVSSTIFVEITVL